MKPTQIETNEEMNGQLNLNTIQFLQKFPGEIEQYTVNPKLLEEGNETTHNQETKSWQRKLSVKATNKYFQPTNKSQLHDHFSNFPFGEANML